MTESDIYQRWGRRADALGYSILSMPEADFDRFMDELKRCNQPLREAEWARWRSERDREHERFSRECENAFLWFMVKAFAVVGVIGYAVHYFVTH